jgi:hypothetical protein
MCIVFFVFINNGFFDVHCFINKRFFDFQFFIYSNNDLIIVVIYSVVKFLDLFNVFSSIGKLHGTRRYPGIVHRPDQLLFRNLRPQCTWYSISIGHCSIRRSNYSCP